MNAKHQFKYTYEDTNLEEFSPVEIAFDMPGEVTINQMLYNFESYLKACGFYFDGHLEVVAEESYEELNASDELDGTLYEFEDEPRGGCMADFDKECVCKTTPRSSEYDEDDGCPTWEEKYGSMADFDKECGCDTTSSSLEDDDEDGPTFHDTLSTAICEDYKQKKQATKEVTKNKWVHGMCNPPAHDAKEYVKDCKSTGKKYNSIDALLKGLMKKRSRDSQLY